MSRSFDKLRALDAVSRAIHESEAFSMLGPNGCGKTTLLRLIAAFDTPEAGRILLGGQDITAPPSSAAGKNNAPPWPVPWSTARVCCCSMNSWPRSI